MTKVAFFVSRNKDNQNVVGFKERKETYFCQDAHELADKFYQFVKEGKKGETSRLYVSVNDRDEDKARKALVCALVMEDVPLEKVKTKAVSLAMKPENAATKKWLFDFDCSNANEFDEFVSDLVQKVETPVDYFLETWRRTKNGYAVVVARGFDTRGFLDEWNERLKKQNPNWGVELKKDAMLLWTWKTNTEG
jgi:hypothetical protein